MQNLSLRNPPTSAEFGPSASGVRVDSSSCSVEPLLTSLQYKTGIDTFKGFMKFKSGKGHFQWSSGLKYSGEYKEDKKEGYGVLTWPDGSKYEGYFHNDVREGKGKHIWGENGEVYLGEYCNDKRHGHGTYTWPTGASFTGSFKEDLKDGPGIYLSAQGEVFEGIYRGDMRDGEGIVTYPGGQQDVGIWKGPYIIQLKFVIKEILFDYLSSEFKIKSHPMTPDMQSRGKYGPKGHIEMTSQELILEAANGNISKVKAIVESGVVYTDVVDKKGHGALFASAIHGHSDIVNYLLDNGADVNRLDEDEISALNACHHILYSPNPQVDSVLNQLHLTRRQSKLVSPSYSDDGETETLFSSDFASSLNVITPHKKGYRNPALTLDLTSMSEESSNLTNRSKSFNVLHRCHQNRGHLLEVDRTSQAQLYKVRSLPSLKPQGDKHVRFTSGKIQKKKSGSSPPSENPGVEEIKSKEIYVNYFMGKIGLEREKTRESSHPQLVISNTDICFQSDNEPEPEGSNEDVIVNSSDSSVLHITASANSDILGVSDVNSCVSSVENSTDNVNTENEQSLISIGPESIHNETDSFSLSGQSKDESFSGIGKLNRHHLKGTCIKPSAGHFHLKGTKYNHRFSSPQFKKCLTVTAQGAGALHGSSVFSSTHYGPIVSAAQSTTLSCYDDSDRDVSGASSTCSVGAVKKETSLCVPEKGIGELIKLLLSRGANPNISSMPMPPLLYAILVGDLELIENLLTRGANTDYCLPDELGGYSLLHIAIGNIIKCTPAIVELFLQHGADPNTGGRTVEKILALDQNLEGKNRHKSKQRVSVAGANEGSIKVTPLHFLCSAELTKSVKDNELLSTVIPVVIQILVNHGAEVNAVANGYSALALLIRNGHDYAIDTILQNGADPNLPLGNGVGNAICSLTTLAAQKTRATVSNSLAIFRKLKIRGVNVFSPVKLAKGEIGTVVDFAYSSFKEDRRLSTLKYSSLSKAERAYYRSAKKLMTFFRNLFRCKALQTFASNDESWRLLKERYHSTQENQANEIFRLVLATAQKPDISTNLNRKRCVLSAGAQTTNTTRSLILPEITLNSTFKSLNKVLNCEEDEDERRITTLPQLKKREKVPKFIRYKDMLEKAITILTSYKEAEEMSEWTFSSFCYECGRSAGVHLNMCGGCEVVSFCSRTCRGECLKKGHKDECRGFDYSFREIGRGERKKRPKSNVS